MIATSTLKFRLWKRFTRLTLALLLLSAWILACRPGSRQQTTLVTILGENTANMEAIAAIVDSYPEDRVKVEVIAETFEELYRRSLGDFEAHEAEYDIHCQYNFSMFALLSNGYVWSAEELVRGVPEERLKFEELLFPAAWREVGFFYRDWRKPASGLIKVGYPFATNTMLLAFNQRMFEDEKNRERFQVHYGYDLAPPSTWQAYRDVAEFFTEQESGSAGVVIEGAPGGWLYYDFMNFLFGLGGGTMKKEHGWQGGPETPIELDSDASIAAADYFLQMKRYNAGNFFGVDQFEKRRLLLDGKAAMAFMWSDTIPGMLHAARERGVSFGFAPIPGEISLLAGGSFFVNRDSPDWREALDLVLWLMAEPQQIKLAEAGLSSGMSSVYRDPGVAKLPYAAALSSSLARGVYALEAGPDSEIVSQILTEELQRAWNGDSNAATAMTAAARRIRHERSRLFSELW